MKKLFTLLLAVSLIFFRMERSREFTVDNVTSSSLIFSI